MDKTTVNTELNILFSFLKEVISWRIKNPDGDIITYAPKLSLKDLDKSVTAQFITNMELSTIETIIFLLALTPHILPDFFLNCIAESYPSGTDLPQFGGVKGKQHRGILPTGETVQFIIAGNHIENRIDCMRFFTKASRFETHRILYLETMPSGEPLLSGKILLYPETLYLVTIGSIPPPKMSAQFPAEKLDTELSWDDLILNTKTISEIKELEIWLKYNNIFLEAWGMKNRVKAGYRTIFHGPPGTGKTLTAALLGKYTGKDVYRIDLSTVVSKYIGETEKNLSNLFDKAAHKNWILFFDEADAIFGKRTNVQSSNDKFANQEVSYLLQRVESHPGLVILATNFKDNIDEAFMRRFQSICEFQLPTGKERYLMWKTNLPEQLYLDPKIDLADIAEKYEVTGSNIINIIQYCSIKVLSLNTNTLHYDLLIEGIKKEYLKENKLF
ncbi:ATP-binding protein [Algibacter pacificus]|uniref:ATP-binding protein n=1 Tax=Algibacter pacificus TaxID=2599389 RepID=UPI0011C89323|nr:ATP-binding protein [Algibacter pacificus]